MASSIVCSLILFIMFSISTTLANYQYLLLALQWGPAQCRVSNFNCRKPAAQDKFMVHGIWPTNYSDPQPEYCILSKTTDQILDTTKFPAPLVTKLRMSWPSLIGDDENFWGYEWKRHGTCSFPKFGQAKYFWLAPGLLKYMDIFDMLKKDGIVPTPGKMLDQNDIIEAIKKYHFGGKVAIKPEFHCRTIPGSKTKPQSSELLEIRLCVDHDGVNYFNCTSGGNCGQKFEWFI